MQHTAVLDSNLHRRIEINHQAREANQADEATTTSELLARASGGDQVAWDQLVERHGGLVWAVARAHGLNLDEAADASHLTWLLLTQHLGSLQQPDRLGEWLATTARRESQRLRRLRSQAAAVADEPDLEARRRPTPAAAVGMLVAEREAGRWHAVGVLPEWCQPLLWLLMVEPPLSDAEIAAALGMPIARVARTRAWCLDCLRRGATAGGSPERPVGRAGLQQQAGMHKEKRHEQPACRAEPCAGRAAHHPTATAGRPGAAGR